MDNSCDNTSAILDQLGLSYDADDIVIMKYICETVSNRAALLVSICEFLLFSFLLINTVAFSLPIAVITIATVIFNDGNNKQKQGLQN